MAACGYHWRGSPNTTPAAGGGGWRDRGGRDAWPTRAGRPGAGDAGAARPRGFVARCLASTECTGYVWIKANEMRGSGDGGLWKEVGDACGDRNVGGARGGGVDARGGGGDHTRTG